MDSTTGKPFGIEIADNGIGALIGALETAPFSEELRRLLWVELLDPNRTKTGPDGVIDYALSPAAIADDLVAGVHLGRAGKALMLALRALRRDALDEIRDGCHARLSIREIEVSDAMLAVGEDVILSAVGGAEGLGVTSIGATSRLNARVLSSTIPITAVERPA